MCTPPRWLLFSLYFRASECQSATTHSARPRNHRVRNGVVRDVLFFQLLSDIRSCSCCCNSGLLGISDTWFIVRTACNTSHGPCAEALDAESPKHKNTNKKRKQLFGHDICVFPTDVHHICMRGAVTISRILPSPAFKTI